MQAVLGPFAATSAAIVSAGVIAVTPVAPPLADRVETAVQLTANSDWSVIFDKAGQGAAALGDSYFGVPFPITQQIIANQISYLGELPDVATIAERIAANFVRGFTAPAAPNRGTLDAEHRFLYDALPLILKLPLVDLFVEISPTGQQLLAFAASPISGVLLGLAGPVVGPALVMGSNLQSIINDVGAAEAGRALTTLLNTPAEMVDAFLNGGVHLDVTELAETLGPTIGVSFPQGTKIGIAFGGLFSPGGSIFNALDMDFHQDPFGLPIIRINLANGKGPGLIGSLIEVNKIIAKAIGWDGSGSPLAPPTNSSQRSALAAVDEVPRSVLTSRMATLTTPTPGVDTAVVGQKASVDTGASTGLDAAVDATTDPATDGEPVLRTRTRGSVTTIDGEPITTPTEGGKHRTKSGRSLGTELDADGADFGNGLGNGVAKHAKAPGDDKPTKAERPARAAATSGDRDRSRDRGIAAG